MPQFLVEYDSALCQICFERFFDPIELGKHYESSHTDGIAVPDMVLDCDSGEDDINEGEIEDGAVNAFPGVGCGYGVGESKDQEEDKIKNEAVNLLNNITCTCGSGGDGELIWIDIDASRKQGSRKMVDEGKST